MKRSRAKNAASYAGYQQSTFLTHWMAFVSVPPWRQCDSTLITTAIKRFTMDKWKKKQIRCCQTKTLFLELANGERVKKSCCTVRQETNTESRDEHENCTLKCNSSLGFIHCHVPRTSYFTSFASSASKKNILLFPLSKTNAMIQYSVVFQLNPVCRSINQPWASSCNKIGPLLQLVSWLYWR